MSEHQGIPALFKGSVRDTRQRRASVQAIREGQILPIAKEFKNFPRKTALNSLEKCGR
jgi:hypothetical protein